MRKWWWCSGWRYPLCWCRVNDAIISSVVHEAHFAPSSSFCQPHPQVPVINSRGALPRPIGCGQSYSSDELLQHPAYYINRYFFANRRGGGVGRWVVKKGNFVVPRKPFTATNIKKYISSCGFLILGADQRSRGMSDILLATYSSAVALNRRCHWFYGQIVNNPMHASPNLICSADDWMIYGKLMQGRFYSWSLNKLGHIG